MTDPKPNMSAAGILANLNYYNALEHRYAAQYREALEQSTYWLRELEKLNTITRGDSGVTTAEESTPLFNTPKGGVQ